MGIQSIAICAINMGANKMKPLQSLSNGVHHYLRVRYLLTALFKEMGHKLDLDNIAPHAVRHHLHQARHSSKSELIFETRDLMRDAAYFAIGSSVAGSIGGALLLEAAKQVQKSRL
jgi:hypothetical protein